ncbi:peptidase inhibitor family I36 protein [Streptomyces smyrnaeus]|uniref:peptidase inhibitor family I36 protein n=1 Tax=Streptomyces smyrnaeus TaxID=1387713 RepID=UPI0033A7D1C6
MIRKTLMLAAAGLMTVSTVSAASALEGPALTGKASCPPKYVCVWDNNSFSGKPKWKSEGDLNKDMRSQNGISIFNNGRAYPGKDHIRYYYRMWSGEYARGCLHYPGDSPSTVVTWDKPVTLEYARWGGEC